MWGGNECLELHLDGEIMTARAHAVLVESKKDIDIKVQPTFLYVFQLHFIFRHKHPVNGDFEVCTT